MSGLVVIEVFTSKRADRDQAVGAGIAKFDEESGAGDAGDAALKGGADAVGEKMRDQAVGGFALRLHGAALGDGDLRRDLAQAFRRLGLRQRAFAKSQAPDQCAMHDKIGVSPDRRGEMRVTSEVQAEMAIILGRIFSLGLRAQHHFIHQRLGVVSFDLRQHAIE